MRKHLIFTVLLFTLIAIGTAIELKRDQERDVAKYGTQLTYLEFVQLRARFNAQVLAADAKDFLARVGL
jgi:hypothetical protein